MTHSKDLVLVWKSFEERDVGGAPDLFHNQLITSQGHREERTVFFFVDLPLTYRGKFPCGYLTIPNTHIPNTYTFLAYRSMSTAL